MFEVPRYRIRAYLESARRRKVAQQKSSLQNLHFKRTKAQLLIKEGPGQPPRIIPATVILNEIQPRGVYVFTAEKIPADTEVSIAIKEPITFFAKGRVVSSEMIRTGQRVITSQPQPIRIGIEFALETAEEQRAIEQYCINLFRDCLSTGF